MCLGSSGGCPPRGTPGQPSCPPSSLGSLPGRAPEARTPFTGSPCFSWCSVYSSENVHAHVHAFIHARADAHAGAGQHKPTRLLVFRQVWLAVCGCTESAQRLLQPSPQLTMPGPMYSVVIFPVQPGRSSGQRANGESRTPQGVADPPLMCTSRTVGCAPTFGVGLTVLWHATLVGARHPLVPRDRHPCCGWLGLLRNGNREPFPSCASCMHTECVQLCRRRVGGCTLGASAVAAVPCSLCV